MNRAAFVAAYGKSLKSWNTRETQLLSGQGLIGKLALFVAEKLISHNLVIALDQKKRACRAFVELYHCLDRLEELNAEFVKTLSYGVEHGGILIGDLQILLPAVDGVSQRFLDLGGELYYALDLLDPTLSEAVYQLCAGKGSFLNLVANGIRYTEPARDVDERRGQVLNLDVLVLLSRSAMPGLSIDLNR